jgi:hypothetical protein
MTCNKHLEVKFAEQNPTRILLEEDLSALDTLSNILIFYVETQPDDPVHFNSTTKHAFLNIAKRIRERVNEKSINYYGKKYIIMAKGRRKFTLGFKREPDIYIGSDWGLNFIEACQSYFASISYHNGYNQRKNTYCGRTLFGLSAEDSSNYAAGIISTSKGYNVWFTLCNQTYTLAPEENVGDAEFQCKMLNKTFENLLTLKKTKPEQPAAI